jgi:hypothetical protein
LHNLLRALGTLALATGLLLPAALPAEAAEPHRPLPGYQPAFVTERDGQRWEDCLWASAAMLVDKWSAGRVGISKDRLRALSRSGEGRSNFDDLRPALSRMGFRARSSPNGGDFVTWAELRTRLAAGGGAILLGDYSDLPRRYGRWDPSFWRNEGEDDNHAIYLDRYDPRRDRYWVMDPLAPSGWQGEWVPARAIRAFAWSTGSGGLWTLMTPAAQPAPFGSVQLDDPIAFAGIDDLHVVWPVEAAPEAWTLPAVDVETSAIRVQGAALPAGDLVVLAPPVLATPLPRVAADPSVKFADDMLLAAVPTPTGPGTYEVSVTLRERRFGLGVATASVTLHVPGERHATLDTPAVLEPVAIGRFAFDVHVANTGSVTWAEPDGVSTAPREAYVPRATRLTATWVPLAGPDIVAAVAADPEVVTADLPTTMQLDALPLAPGDDVTIHANVPTPERPGRWALVLDVVDDHAGSFAAGGSRAGVLLVELVLPIGPATPH